MMYRSRIRFRRFLRRLLRHSDPPERVARGIAAGFFAAAFPLPGLQIPISLFAAWVVRGNKAVAIMPQFISNAGTMLPIAWFQIWLGAKFWHHGNTDIDAGLVGLKTAGEAWAWSAPAESFRTLGRAVGELGADILGPLSIGVVLTAFAGALLAYPLSLVGITFYYGYRARKRAERGIGLRPPRGHLTLAEYGSRGNEAPILGYAVRQQSYIYADSVALLADGRQAYPEMLRCIAGAKKSIRIETYILHADKVGWRFAAALAAAARRGVDVQLCFDGVGALGLPQEYVNALLEAGVKVAVYRPLSMLWKLGLGPMNRRNHRKILVVDESIAFAGGLNIGDEYAAKEDGGADWRDTHIRIDGAAPARLLQDLVNQTCRASRPFSLSEAKSPADPAVVEAMKTEDWGRLPPVAPTSNRVLMQVLSNQEFLKRVRIRHAYIHAIRQARRYILIENAYFIPDRGIRRALRNAVKRGVTVAVVVAMYSDVEIAAMASRSLYGELLSSGVRLFEFPRSMMHCKTAVIDDIWSVVSSYNLDHRSLKHNLEASVFLLDHPFARALREQILTDISHCREVTLQFHESRPWNQALVESMAYQARYWL